MIDIVMPFLSETMEEGTIRRWLKHPGDTVAHGEDLVEVEADKATVLYQADDSGVLVEILVDEGTTVPPGHVIARMSAADEVHFVPQPFDSEQKDAVQRRQSPSVSERASNATEPELPSSANVAAEIPVAPSSEGNVRQVRLTPAQRAMARQLMRSTGTVPFFCLSVDVDMTKAIEIQQRVRATAKSSAHPTVTDVMVRSSAIVLRDNLRVNSAFAGDYVNTYSRINVAFAVATDDAVLAPVIFDADRTSLEAIANSAHYLARRARDGTITPAELQGATFTVSNLGMFGVDAFTAVINPPQAAILAVGRIRLVPVINADGDIRAMKTVTLTLSCDHRVLTGVEAARFLTAMKEQLEDSYLWSR